MTNIPALPRDVEKRCRDILKMSDDQIAWLNANLYNYMSPDWSEMDWSEIDQMVAECLKYRDQSSGS